MIEQEYIMLIMNCKKYRAKALYQKKTWLKLLPPYLKYYHVLGDTSLESAYKFDEDEQILWVKTLDDYNSLPNKVIASYRAIQETFQFKYLFKTDDDQILVNPKFFDTTIAVINVKKPTPHYGGYIVDVPIPYMSEYYKIHPELPKNMIIQKTRYCSGRFYFLSCKAIEDLIEKRTDVCKEFLEDYAVGYYLDEKWKRDMINIATNKQFADIENSDFPGV